MSILDKLPKPESENCVIDYAGILEILPHRFPFLLVDRVISVDVENQKLVAQKNVSFNEPFFQGHFPSEPVMPGVLQVEAMAQAMGILMLCIDEKGADKRPAFISIDACKFRRPVRPGDVLSIEVTMERLRRGMGTAQVEIKVDDQIASSAKLVATMV